MLTKRGKHLGRDIPMCGVPIERADEYLHRLIALGHRVAVCEQLEDPAQARKRGSKSVVRRDVVRLVTPGTLTEDSLLDAKRNNYLLALARSRVSSGEDRFALAWIDISTGEFRVAECDRASLAAAVARIEPGEIVVADAVYADTELAPMMRALPALTPLTRDVFDGATAERRLAAFFGVATTASFGAFSRIELAAAAAAVTYVERTQIGKRPPLSVPTRERAGATLAIDQATRGNLELIRTLAGDRRGSLLAAIDRTVTAAGSRLLAQRLAAPLTDAAEIAHRLDAVGAFVDDPALRNGLRTRLKAAPDLLRALARIVVGRGGPRDLAAIGDGIVAASELAARLAASAQLPRELAQAVDALRRPDGAIAAELDHALAEELPALRRDGGFVRAGYEAALDEARALRDESRRVIAALQVRYAETTGIRALKIRHNNVLGYFVDVSAQHGDKLMSAPLNATFIHRQTTAGQVRFTTTELGELEAKIATAAERALALELEIFDRLAAAIAAAIVPIKEAADAIALLDVATALATLAVERDYTRPTVDDGLAFAIAGGRHPVVEQALVANGGPFVANDCDLSPPSAVHPSPQASETAAAGRIWLVTGPNMAGKSTFLRQNALIVVLAQMGSYVPARSAHIGIVDRLFSRVGAADDLARGHSTFMVEMVETAAILNQAGERALVILDEIGRGTATFDGLSIAWATIEHLHEANRCRALFATHFHEMTALAAKLPRLHNVTMRVKEWQGDVVFLHEVIAGAADRSYGIQVAKLAGLPASVIERAKLVLAQLEAEDRVSPARALIDDLPLFAATREAPLPARDDPRDAAIEALTALHPDEMSPRDALEALYALKTKLAATKS
jgi:DNA mismatch repair protein MutS